MAQPMIALRLSASLLPRLLVFATLVLGVLHAPPAGAQPVLPAGTRARVVMVDSTSATSGARGRGVLTGTVVSSDSTVLLLETAPPPRRIALAVAGLQRIDVSRGRPNRRAMGAVIGGLISGAAFVGAACAFSDGSCDVRGDLGGFLAYYAVGALPGALVGDRVGARRPGPERWKTVWTAP